MSPPVSLVPLAEVTYTVRELVDVGRGPLGHLLVAEVESAEVTGDRLRGSMRGTAGADWVTATRGGLSFDVRWTLATHDGALVHVRYHGRQATDGAEGRASPVFCAPMFHTADDRYAWLNHVVAVGKGAFVDDRTVRYSWQEVR